MKKEKRNRDNREVYPMERGIEERSKTDQIEKRYLLQRSKDNKEIFLF